MIMIQHKFNIEVIISSSMGTYSGMLALCCVFKNLQLECYNPVTELGRLCSHWLTAFLERNCGNVISCFCCGGHFVRPLCPGGLTTPLDTIYFSFSADTSRCQYAFQPIPFRNLPLAPKLAISICKTLKSTTNLSYPYSSGHVNITFFAIANSAQPTVLG